MFSIIKPNKHVLYAQPVWRKQEVSRFQFSIEVQAGRLVGLHSNWMAIEGLCDLIREKKYSKYNPLHFQLFTSIKAVCLSLTSVNWDKHYHFWLDSTRFRSLVTMHFPRTSIRTHWSTFALIAFRYSKTVTRKINQGLFECSRIYNAFSSYSQSLQLISLYPEPKQK